MDKIKVLFIHSGAELYGADQILLTIVSNLDKNIYEPIVVLPNDGPLVLKLKDNKIRTEIIEYPIIRRKYFNVKGIFSYITQYRKACKKISKFITDENISIVHNNTIAVLEGIYLKKKFKKKVKLITHIHEMIDHPRIVAKTLYKFHVKNCDKIIVVSKAVKKHIEAMLNKKIDTIEVVYNGIAEVNVTTKKDYYKEFNIDENARVLAVIGRINNIKGQDHFVEAIEQILAEGENVYGLIIGDAFSGQEWRVEKLKELIKEKHLEDKVIYCGFRSDVKELYSIIDVLILPSVEHDSFPTVVLEAMSAEKPIVAYKCGGVEEMVKDDYNGYLVEQGNVLSLKKQILNLIKDEDKLVEYGKNSKKIFVDKFCLNKFIDKISKIYKEYGDVSEGDNII